MSPTGESLMAEFSKAAIEKAIGLVTHFLHKAEAVGEANAEACIYYIKAAQSAIAGLEQEYDEILVQCRMVATYRWDGRGDLAERINRYLNTDRLRPELDKAVHGIEKCVSFMSAHPNKFFVMLHLHHAPNAAAMKSLDQLLGQLSDYLKSLSVTMGFERVEYAGPSGLNALVLLEMEELLKPGKVPYTEDQIKAKLFAMAKDYQSGQKRLGLPVVADATGVIQEIATAFRLAIQAEA